MNKSYLWIHIWNMNIHNQIKDVGMSVMIMECQYLILNLQNALIILPKCFCLDKILYKRIHAAVIALLKAQDFCGAGRNWYFACRLFRRSTLCNGTKQQTPDSKVHGANMRPTWVLSAPDGPHVGPINLAIRDPLQNSPACMPLDCSNASGLDNLVIIYIGNPHIGKTSFILNQALGLRLPTRISHNSIWFRAWIIDCNGGLS